MMSESHLPEDPSRWPENPFELLGVPPSVDSKSLKRAYQSLIRVYRPEELPGQFRRIREAFEAASAILEMTSAKAGAEPAAGRTPAMPRSAPRERPGGSPPETTTTRDSAADELAASSGFDARLVEAWQALREERPADAYRLLQTLTREHPERPEPYLGRYWLLRISGRLDGDRHPCDELIDCITNAPAARRAAVDLYRRELDRRPDETESIRCERLVRELLVDGPVFIIAEPRWRWAAAKSRWTVLRDDLAILRRSNASMDRALWLPTLWSAMEITAWSGDFNAIGVHVDCKTEIERTNDARTAMIGNLSQTEYFLEVVQAVRVCPDDPQFADFKRFVVSTWSKPVADLYVDFCRFIAPYASAGRPLLHLLSTAGAGAALNRFGETVRLLTQELVGQETPFWTVETARREVNRFLNVAPWKSHSEFRPALLNFCLQQALPPFSVAELVDKQARYSFADGTSLAQRIAVDRPLVFAYEALRLFQG